MGQGRGPGRGIDRLGAYSRRRALARAPSVLVTVAVLTWTADEEQSGEHCS